jgi:LacI family transcriptional regulator
VILTSTLFGDARELEALVRSGLPIVLANRVRDDLPVDGIALDNEGGGHLATRHLIGHGRRSIAYIGGRAETATDEGRRSGYLRALEEADLAPHLVPQRLGLFTREHGYESTRTLLAGPRPDAILAADDTIAFGCLDALAEAGVRVPEEISVVGFDDIPAASLRSISLTTVSTAARTMGTRAVELLLERLQGTFTGAPRREVLRARLVVRATCGDHPSPVRRPRRPFRQSRVATRRPSIAAPAGGRS